MTTARHQRLAAVGDVAGVVSPVSAAVTANKHLLPQPELPCTTSGRRQHSALSPGAKPGSAVGKKFQFWLHHSAG